MAPNCDVVTLPGPGPFGFRLSQQGDYAKISKLRPKSKAAQAGLNEGDIVIAINGLMCDPSKNEETAKMLESSPSLSLHKLSANASSSEISATVEQLKSQLKSDVPQQTPQSSAPTIGNFSTVTVVEPSGAVTSGKADIQFSIQPVLNSEAESDKFKAKEEVIVYRHVPNMPQTTAPPPPVFQNNANLLIKKPAVETNLSPKPYQPVLSEEDENENIIPTGPATAVSLLIHPPENRPVTQIRQPSPEKIPMAISTPGLDKEFRVTPIQASPWIWSPSHAYEIKSKPMEEFTLDPVDISVKAMQEEIVARHTVDGGDRNGSTTGYTDDNDLPATIIKILTNVANPYASFYKKKNIYADSSFFEDPEHTYPTIQEQIKIAMKVAKSLTDPANVRARGQKMFIRRKERSKFWNIDNPAYHKEASKHDLYYNPTPWTAEKNIETSDKTEVLSRTWDTPTKRLDTTTKWGKGIETGKNPAVKWQPSNESPAVTWESLTSKNEMSTNEWEPARAPSAPPYISGAGKSTFKSKKKMFKVYDSRSKGKTVSVGSSFRVQFEPNKELLSKRGRAGQMFAESRIKAEQEDSTVSSGQEPSKGFKFNRPLKDWNPTVKEEGKEERSAPSRLKELIEANNNSTTNPWDSGTFGKKEGVFMEEVKMRSSSVSSGLQSAGHESLFERLASTNRKTFKPVEFRAPPVFDSTPDLRQTDTTVAADFNNNEPSSEFKENEAPISEF